MITIVPLIYALLMFSGAFFGWKAGSKISIIMGVVSGVLILIGIAIVNVDMTIGYIYLIVMGGMLSGVFVKRLSKTKKFMPAGMLLLISIAFVMFCIVTIL